MQQFLEQEHRRNMGSGSSKHSVSNVSQVCGMTTSACDKLLVTALSSHAPPAAPCHNTHPPAPLITWAAGPSVPAPPGCASGQQQTPAQSQMQAAATDPGEKGRERQHSGSAGVHENFTVAGWPNQALPQLCVFATSVSQPTVRARPSKAVKPNPQPTHSTPTCQAVWPMC